MSYLAPELQKQIAVNNSGLGWTPGPDGKFVPVAINYQQPVLGQNAPTNNMVSKLLEPESLLRIFGIALVVFLASQVSSKWNKK